MPPNTIRYSQTLEHASKVMGVISVVKIKSDSFIGLLPKKIHPFGDYGEDGQETKVSDNF